MELCLRHSEQIRIHKRHDQRKWACHIFCKWIWHWRALWLNSASHNRIWQHLWCSKRVILYHTLPFKGRRDYRRWQFRIVRLMMPCLTFVRDRRLNVDNNVGRKRHFNVILMVKNRHFYLWNCHFYFTTTKDHKAISLQRSLFVNSATSL